eukprot:TRINITY_DN3967_c0_g2_i2.p1 TRINITY_DN3967_c0_g2~~TRINITY_DN3967_c0_g2_i2.p1  ORF type:complete len:325 (-),score=48.68 TRINITY_DN3967_c0_g2_i2:97-1071(-)
MSLILNNLTQNRCEDGGQNNNKICRVSYFYRQNRIKGGAQVGHRTKAFQVLCKSKNDKSREDLLKGVCEDTREAVSQVLEKSVRAVENWSKVTSNFLSPPEFQDAIMVLNKLSDVGVMSWGGYGQAERKVIIAGREDIIDGLHQNQPQHIFEDIIVVQVSGNFLFDPANHRDFLGACLGCGIERSQVGDILVQGEKGAQIIINKNMTEFLQTALQKVRSVPVEVRPIPFEELKVPEVKFKDIKSTEHSQRLDAIASSGFRVSRGTMAGLIKSGDVKLNWRQVEKPSLDVNVGDVISCTGKGKINVVGIEQNKKGKFNVKLQVLK